MERQDRYRRFDCDSLDVPLDEDAAARPLPLILLPGTLCDERVFAPLTDRLECQAIVAQIGKFGGIDAEVSMVLETAPARFVLLGFSLGGIVALAIARAAPDRVAGLVLIGATPLPVDPGRYAERRDAVAVARHQGLGTYVGETLWPSYVAGSAQDNAELRSLVVAMADRAGVETFALQTELALSRPDYCACLADLAMPVLVMAGVEDAINPPAAQRAMAEAIPNAQLSLVEQAGHFVPLEQPGIVADTIAAWLNRPDDQAIDWKAPITRQQEGGSMSKSENANRGVGGAVRPTSGETGAILQVERRDFAQLVPEGRERVQSLRGFDDCYTDIVDYIVRCTHKIWDERDVGLIYSHYTWNCVAYTTLGTMYDRETHIRDTLQRLVEFPERRGMAQQVIWRGDDVDGFYTSHMTHGIGRHTQFGMYGKPTGRSFITRTVADCMILENKIYKEWIVRDNMGPLIQLGIDPHAFAADLASKKIEAGEQLVDILENRRMVGQYPPETEADVSIAHNDGEAELLRDLHHIYNKRMFGRIEKIYAPNCQWHGPLMRELYGSAAVLQQTMRLVALIPDGAFVPQHICSVESEQGGVKYAVRWMIEGHHLGYGPLGAPTGHPLFVMGVSHFHIKDGKIVEEWAVYDELSLLVQIKMADLEYDKRLAD